MTLLLGLDAFRLLSKYDIPWVRTVKAEDESRLFSMKTPFYMKAVSPSAVHKTEKKAISLIYDESQIDKEYHRLRKIGHVIAQEKFDGIEVIVGAKNDPTFGKVVLVGVGGVFVEVVKDVAFRVAPITRKDAKDMLKELKAYKILKGYRGKGVNLELLEKILVNVGRLAVKEDISELDINPLIIDKNRGYAVDARVII